MTTKRRRTRLRRRKDEPGSDAPAKQAQSDDGARDPSPGHALLQLQAQRGNAAMQRLVTGAGQLQRQLEDEDEEQQAPADEDIYEDADSDPQAEMIAAMWDAGVLVPLAGAIEKMQSGEQRDIRGAFDDVEAARTFHGSLKETVGTQFPDAKDKWSAVLEGIQLVKVGLMAHLGAPASVESLSTHLEAVRAIAETFPAALQGSE